MWICQRYGSFNALMLLACLSGSISQAQTAIDPRTVERLSPSEARLLVASTGETLSLPCLHSLTLDAAHELATYREKSGICMTTVCEPVPVEKSVTYTIMESYTEEKVAEGRTFTVTKCRPVKRSRVVAYANCVPVKREHRCPHVLSLDGLSEVSTDVLDELVQHDGDLHLNGLGHLTADQAASLANHRGGALALNGLTSLDLETATQLVRRGIDSLSDDEPREAAAQRHVICKHSKPLFLNGLKAVSDDVAAVLATYGGAVHLAGLVDVSDEAMRMLRKPHNTLPAVARSLEKKEK